SESACGEGLSQGLADAGFVVVAALVRGDDAAKAGIEGHAHESTRVVLLPRRAVDEGGHAGGLHGGESRGSRRWLHDGLRSMAVGAGPRRAPHEGFNPLPPVVTDNRAATGRLIVKIRGVTANNRK